MMAHGPRPVGTPHVVQIPYSVIADMSPAERLKYEGHFAKVKGASGAVEVDRAKRFFSKAALPVSTWGLGSKPQTRNTTLKPTFFLKVSLPVSGQGAGPTGSILHSLSGDGSTMGSTMSSASESSCLLLLCNGVKKGHHLQAASDPCIS